MKTSAGLLAYKKLPNNNLKIFLCKPGGPFFRNVEFGIWSIPKGEVEKNELLLATAMREFEEETGIWILRKSAKSFQELGEVKLKSGKIVNIFAIEVKDEEIPDDVKIKSNLFELEFPKGSGKFIKVPEMEEGRFFDLYEVGQRITEYQLEFVSRLYDVVYNNKEF